MNRRFWFLIFTAVALLLLIVVTPGFQGYQAQGDPTRRQQTIDAIINPRLTLTARGVAAQTATGLAYAMQTNIANLTALAVTNEAYQTETVLALTHTSTPTLTPTVSETIATEVSPDLTQQFQTLISSVNERLTKTAIVQQTADFQATVDYIIAQTLGFTATPTISLTPSITPTLNVEEAQQTIQALIDLSLTQTPQAAIAQSATAAIQATINAITSRDLTATAILRRATLVYGLEPISVVNAHRVELMQMLSGHIRPVQAVAFSFDGTRFASAGLDNTVRLWDTRTGENLGVLRGLTDRLSVAFSPDGAYLAAASSDNTVRIWEIQTGREARVLRGHQDDVLSVAFNPDNLVLASASADGTVRIWNVQTGNLMLTLEGPAPEPPRRGTPPPPPPMTSVVFSPDGMRVAGGRQDGLITIWETSTGIELGAFRDEQPVRALAFSPNGSLIASGGAGPAIAVWNIDINIRLASLAGQPGPITSLSFSADSTCLASGSAEGTITLWDAIIGTSLATLEVHTSAVNSVAFSPDGARLLSGSADLTVRVWGIPTNR